MKGDKKTNLKILMVCRGNICRSPLAEGILQAKANLSNLNWIVDSAATTREHTGEAPHRISIKVAKLNGIDISKQKSRQFVKEDFERYDYIYVMDGENYSDCKYMSKTCWIDSKINYILNELYSNENRDVPDPWYGGEDGFHEVFKMLDDACNNIIKKFS